MPSVRNSQNVSVLVWFLYINHYRADSREYTPVSSKIITTNDTGGNSQKSASYSTCYMNWCIADDVVEKKRRKTIAESADF